jgi:6-methylsalicylate decarboxylase
MAQAYRIDVHHHPSPPTYLASRFERDKQYAQQQNWSIAKSLEDMDRGGVATTFLSLPHSVQIWPGNNQEARTLARGWNEFMAKMAAASGFSPRCRFSISRAASRRSNMRSIRSRRTASR